MRREIYLSIAATSALLSLGNFNFVHGETIQLQASADTVLFQNDPDNNFGAVDSLAVGGTASGALARSLIKFDVAASLPANAKIVSAQLKFEIVKIPTSGGRPSDLRLQRMLQDWSEGSQAGGPRGATAVTGESTWNFRVHPTVRWSENEISVEGRRSGSFSRRIFRTASCGQKFKSPRVAERDAVARSRIECTVVDGV